MPSTSEIILSANTHPGDSTTETVTGSNFKGDGYYGRSDGMHTVQYVSIFDENGPLPRAQNPDAKTPWRHSYYAYELREYITYCT